MAGFTYADANTYFKPNNHIHGALWTGSDVDRRKAALAQGQRLLEKFKRADLDEPGDNADNTDIREDYALFEQALWILTNTPLTSNAEGIAQAWTLTDKEGKAAKRDSRLLAPEAKSWMGWNANWFVRG